MFEQDMLQLSSRDLAMSVAHVYIGALLVDHCCSKQCTDTDIRTLSQWTRERDLTPVLTYAERGAYDGGGNATVAYVYDGYDPDNVQ